MATIINASTSSGLIQTADTSGILQLQSNGTTIQTIDSTGSYGQIRSATVNAGGTNPFPSSGGPVSVDFTSIPSWVKRITLMFQGVSLSGSSNALIQLGSGSVQITGYVGTSTTIVTTGTGALSSTAGIPIQLITAANVSSGALILNLITGNTWVASGSFNLTTTANVVATGSVTLSGAIDRLRITTVNGTDTFDAGSINILYEG
jgi:hypothetical protein